MAPETQIEAGSEAGSESGAAPERAALSIDEAAGLLAPPETEATGTEASGTEDGAPAAPEADDAGAGGEAETPAEPPAFWTDEDKAWFSAQPEDVRERLLAWAAREASTARAKADAAQSKAAAQAEAKALADTRGAIDAVLGEARRRLSESGWEAVDWARWAAEDPAAALQGKIRFEQEQAQAQRLAAASRAAHDRAFSAWVAGEETRLAELAPELASDTGKRDEIATWLLAQGYAPDALRAVSARDLVTARKAMLWDRAEAALKAPRPASPPASRAVRASARPAAATPQRRAAEAHNRFSQTRALDDAVAVLNARN